VAGPAPAGVEAAARPYLTIFSEGSATVFQFAHDGAYLVGRDSSAAIALGDASASRRHAEIRISGQTASVVDLDSANGTRVDGQRAAGTVPLSPGAVISIGATDMVFQWRVQREASRLVLDRPHFEQLLEAEVERSIRHTHPLALALLRVEGGSGTMAAVGAAIAQAMRRMDRLGRLDETTLAVLLPELASEDAGGVCDRILQQARKIAPGLRAGMAEWPSDGYTMDTLVLAARSALEQATSGQVVRARATVIELRLGRHRVGFADPAMLRLLALARRLAQSNIPVLISGETGSGKELFANAIHELSSRSATPLMTINCAALPETLAESELFGHARGAFSGALAHRVGRLEAADGGTVFLDEIGELPLSIQAKLLRVLEDKAITRLGENQPRGIDIRVVAATNRDLPQRIAEGAFRQDLFFRLSGASLFVPPLRERPRDIPLLVQTILGELAGRDHGPLSITPEAMGLLVGYSWPGNVRELRHALAHAAAIALGSVIEAWMLPSAITGCASEPVATGAAVAGRNFRPIEDEVRELEVRRMKDALDATGGVQTRAAALISMPLRTFQAKCRRYGLGSRPGRVRTRSGPVTPVRNDG
jgi:DNA-binding NtrC family response regulator